MGRRGILKGFGASTTLSQMQRYRAYLLIGAPGSGKGTQGKALGVLPQFFHCACGDVFRSIDIRTPVGQAFLEYSSKGQLVPDNITVELWLSRITSCVVNGSFKPEIDYLVLDGIPRNTNQAQLMEHLIDVKKVFYLNCSGREDLLYARLKKRALKDNRLDDADESVIQRRLKVYNLELKPLLEYYPDQLCEIDATLSPHKVLYNILSTIIKDEQL
jgi:adenylate kinase